ncbi:CinA family protein [Marisediminicola sp. LYQ85]|uniref:CinA family protein n=1 Tax=Marisediminicola sp. LYQ85 TaxID=3391062 RepID=UPI003983B27A
MTADSVVASEGALDRVPAETPGERIADTVVARLAERHLTIAVAESLTAGLVTAELASVAGASEVLLGSVTAYSTDIKHSVLDVSADLLALHGPVHPDVAMQMAANVRAVLARRGVPADVGISTTGVAGPGPHDGHPAGTVFVGIAVGGDVRAVALQLSGDRGAVRSGVVSELLTSLASRLAEL